MTQRFCRGALTTLEAYAYRKKDYCSYPTDKETRRLGKQAHNRAGCEDVSAKEALSRKGVSERFAKAPSSQCASRNESGRD